jgi:hypothetical protein
VGIAGCEFQAWLEVRPRGACVSRGKVRDNIFAIGRCESGNCLPRNFARKPNWQCKLREISYLEGYNLIDFDRRHSEFDGAASLLELNICLRAQKRCRLDFYLARKLDANRLVTESDGPRMRPRKAFGPL